MDAVQRQLMSCLAAYRTGSCVTVLQPDFCAPDRWKKLYRLAKVHKLAPVVFETMGSLSAFCDTEPELLKVWKKETFSQAVGQAMRTQCIVRVSEMLTQNQIPHAIVKGILCRALYKKPDVRISGDEDLLIDAADVERCHQLLEQNGIELMDGVGGDDVTHWKDKKTGLHIELHTQLFSSKRAEDAVLNQVFSEQLHHTVIASLPEGNVQTLHPTYHFVFLVCHALKHFLTGGFGIRMICDIISFAEQYREEIHHQTAYILLERVNARKFLDQLLSVGQDWLAFDPKENGWSFSEKPDAGDLLQDSLDAGIYGQSTMSRKHSAGIVMQAAEGQSLKSSTLSAVFPNRERMQGKYPVLKKKPVLLPLCWAHRLGKYAVEVIHTKKNGNSPVESVALGKKRTEMMVKYGVLPKNKKKN